MNQEIIDWAQSIKRAGNNPDAAYEFLILLSSDLSKESDEMKQSFKNHDLKKMKDQLHKLRGALSYTALPKLAHATQELEVAIVSEKKENLLYLLNQFESASKEIIRYTNSLIKERELV